MKILASMTLVTAIVLSACVDTTLTPEEQAAQQEAYIRLTVEKIKRVGKPLTLSVRQLQVFDASCFLSQLYAISANVSPERLEELMVMCNQIADALDAARLAAAAAVTS